MALIWYGVPIHRCRLVKDFLVNSAAQPLHLECLPAYAPELNPDEGIWERLKGIELHNLCCFDTHHLRQELNDAVQRVRRKPCLIQDFFQGAEL